MTKDPERLTVVRRHHSIPLVTLLVVLTALPALAQPPDDQGRNELIVLLAPSPPAPRPEEIADAINGRGPVPGGLAEGNPEHAEVLGYPAKGRLLEYVLANPESAEARLTRYLLLRFPVHVNLDGIATALSRNPNVQNVEKVVPLRFHVSSAPPTKAIPSDDLVGTGASLPEDAQWGLHLLNLPDAWDLSTGWGLVALLDVGLMVNHEDLKVFGTDEGSGQLRLGPFREHLSDDLDWLGCGVDEMEPGEGNDTTVGHGTHVSGIAAGRANNGRGIAGACWDCGISMIRLDQKNNGKILTAYRQTLTYGAQALSMSFGLPQGPCAPGDPGQFCSALQLAANRDALLVASAGNDLEGVEFPANDSKVIGVGGLEWIGVDPADQTPIAQFWSEEPNCPLPPGVVPKPECGSNFGPELDLAAPAARVLSTLYVGSDYRLDLGCADSLHPAPGYGPCTGTSMSSPFVAGVGMLVRAVNPLLNRDDVYDILTSTASQAGNRTDQLGYGYPDAKAAVEVALGKVNGKTLPNRLTPLFSFFGTSGDPDPVDQRDDDWAYTTVPTAASGFLMPLDTLLGEEPDPYQTEVPTGLPKLVPGYGTFPGIPSCSFPCETVPRASIYVFTTSKPPFPSAPELVPLYRLRYDPDLFRRCDGTVSKTAGRDFAYVTTAAEVRTFKTSVLDANGKGYDLDGIEGYLYKSCEGQPGCTRPPGTVKAYRAFNATRYDYALFPEDELAAMQVAGYTAQTAVIGYAYPNVDSDSDTLIDGFEMLINTDPHSGDTDCDGASDGNEVRVYSPSAHQSGDPLLGPCWTLDTIFANGFESGDTSRWSATVP